MSIHSDLSPLLWSSGFLSLIAGERVRAVAGELALHEFPAKYSLHYELSIVILSVVMKHELIRPMHYATKGVKKDRICWLKWSLDFSKKLETRLARVIPPLSESELAPVRLFLWSYFITIHYIREIPASLSSIVTNVRGRVFALFWLQKSKIYHT